MIHSGSTERTRTTSSDPQPTLTAPAAPGGRAASAVPATVHWLAPSAQPTDVPAAAPLLGAGVAALLCAAIAWLGWLVDLPGGWMVGLLGLPGSTVLAWKLAPRVISADRGGAFGVAVGLAIGSILVADAIVVAFFVAGSAAGIMTGVSIDGTPSPFAEAIGGLAGLALLGIVVFVVGALSVGMLVSVIAVPAALIWAALVRWLAGRARA